MVSIYVHHVGHTSPANKQLFSQNLNQNYHYENNIIFIDKTIYIQQYLHKKTQSPDKYCKECRKSLSRRQYGSGKKLPHCSLSGGRVSYPVITQTEDRETRLRLILHALQVVRLSMERKKAGMQEEALL